MLFILHVYMCIFFEDFTFGVWTYVLCVFFPIVTVDDGAILDVQFVDFSFPPPDGFDRIMHERNIL